MNFNDRGNMEIFGDVKQSSSFDGWEVILMNFLWWYFDWDKVMLLYWKIDVMIMSFCCDLVNLMFVVDFISSFNVLRCWILFLKMFV